MLPTFAHVRARTLADAVAELRAPGSRPLAGGTDLLGCLRDGVMPVSRVVSLAAVPDLHGLEARPDGSLRIGALTPVADLAASPLVRQRFPTLSRAAQAVGSPQIRNRGTLGGNLCQRPRCWYFRGGFTCARKGGNECFAQSGRNVRHAILGGGDCVMVHPSDTAPALVALEALVRIAGPRGERTMPVAELFVGPDRDLHRETVLAPGELLVEVLVPATGAHHHGTYEKVRGRGSFDFALAGVALSLALEGGVVRRPHVVLSGVAPVPWRATAAERVLDGSRLEPAVIERAAEAAVAGAAPLDENAYKVDLARGLVARALSSLS